jgi:hypothetical protein
MRVLCEAASPAAGVDAWPHLPEGGRHVAGAGGGVLAGALQQ